MPSRVPWLGPLMAAAIALTAGLAYWDAQRESLSALADFATEQATLARGVAAAVSSHARGDAPATAVELLAPVRSIERPSNLRLLLARSDEPGLTMSDGTRVHHAGVEQGVRDGVDSVRIDRDDAPAFGLPRRTAVAGLGRFDGPDGRIGVIVAATALRERDRERRAQWRSVVAVMLASGFVLAFGGLAMRKQRKELELARELSIADLRRDREEQLVHIDKLGTLAALASGIAHELSTPLGVIVGRAEQLLPKLDSDERARKNVESIIEQGTRISHVVRGFLNLARGEAPSLEVVKLGTVVEAAGALVQHRFESAGVRLETVLDEPLPQVRCDPRLLEQVIINLLLNACDACQRGGHVELRVCSSAGGVSFVVTDDGVGITPEAAARATEPFFTTKPAGEGTGLGLAIANEIVKHHGGTLSIGARPPLEGKAPPRGTRADVTLPLGKGNA